MKRQASAPRGPRLKLWDRRADESAAAFAKFEIYRDLPAVERAVNAPYARHSGRDRPKAPGSWYELAARFEWEERARAWDLEERRACERALRERRLGMLVETADLGEALRKRAAEALKLLRATRDEWVEEGGKRIRRVSSNLSPDQIMRMLKVGADLECFALGLPAGRPSILADVRDEPLDRDVQEEALVRAHAELDRRLDEIRARQDLAAGGADQAATGRKTQSNQGCDHAPPDRAARSPATRFRPGSPAGGALSRPRGALV
jgi:hypothetical protein